MKKIKINKKILIIYSLIYLSSILITYSFLDKNIKPVYEFNFSLSAKKAYEIELLIGNEYREKKRGYLELLISEYQNSSADLYLNDYFSSNLFSDFNSEAIADTTFKFAISSLSDWEKFRLILEKCDLPNKIKNTIINNLFTNNMFNFNNFRKNVITSERVSNETAQFTFVLKAISENEMELFVNEFKKTIEEESLNYAKKLFFVNISIQYLKDELYKEIIKINNDTKVINFYIDNISNRSLNKNLAIFISLLLPIIFVLSIELLRLLVLNRINKRKT